MEHKCRALNLDVCTFNIQGEEELIAAASTVLAKQLKLAAGGIVVAGTTEAEEAPTLVTLSLSTLGKDELTLGEEVQADVVDSIAEQLGVDPASVQIVESKDKPSGKTELSVRILKQPPSSGEQAKKDGDEASKKKSEEVQAIERPSHARSAKATERKRRARQAKMAAREAAAAPALAEQAADAVFEVLPGCGVQVVGVEVDQEGEDGAGTVALKLLVGSAGDHDEPLRIDAMKNTELVVAVAQELGVELEDVAITESATRKNGKVEICMSVKDTARRSPHQHSQSKPHFAPC